jgi:arylformamidase
MNDKRVVFDFTLTFTNGGGLQGQDFRLDIAGDDITDEELAAYLIRDLRLLMVGDVQIMNKHIITEPHKRTPPHQEELSLRVFDLRTESLTIEQVVQHAARMTIRVIGPDGDSYLVRRAAD